MRLSLILEICLCMNVDYFLHLGIIKKPKKLGLVSNNLMFSDATESKIHLFKWVSGNQRPALGIGSTAVAWDRRLLGKANLASLLFAVQGKARLSVAKEGVGMCHTLTENSKSLFPLSSWHQWLQRLWLSTLRSHQLCLPTFSDPSLGTTVQFYINFQETFHQLMSKVHHTSNIIWGLNSHWLGWSLLHCNSSSDLRKLLLSLWWNNFSVINLLQYL